MTTQKIHKLEKNLYKVINDIRNAGSSTETLKYVRRFGILDRHYFKMTNRRFTPAVALDQDTQDVRWESDGDGNLRYPILDGRGLE